MNSRASRWWGDGQRPPPHVSPLFRVAVELRSESLRLPLVTRLGFSEVSVSVLEGSETLEQVLYFGVVLRRRFHDLPKEKARRFVRWSYVR